MTASGGDTLVAVWVQPRASRSEITGVVDGRLRVRVNAPPHENRANDEVRRLFASRLHVPPSAVSIATGAGSRRKVIRITGLVAGEAARRLQL